jgi:hypothetical protein
MTTKLYYHKTDGGAEYLCTAPVEGTDDGDLSTAAIRLDGQPETCGKFDRVYSVNAALLAALDRYLKRLNYHTDGVDSCDLESADELAISEARAAIAKARGE